ncbi:glycerate kinase [Rhizobium laguerreae]|uniref:glycerate kinase type-2 family protein n=1 Tax=Rhizobiaceae TaxID=82115 RepID=UPI000C9BE980|nr:MULTISPECIES: glycerate kinase [Rhizobiaceae]MBY3473688.1 glycerate kinase [Rhizobium laguerreae]MBY3521694.1 glycerate kinase [Rhizobium laguerreae]PND26027.1 glycerate kinase [Sinorhizobium sp. M4_45]
MAIVPDTRAFLSELFCAAVAAADPYEAIRANLPQQPKGRTVVVGAGKASVAMARAFDSLWKGPLEGVVVTKHRTGASCGRIEVVEAGHPVPDAASVEASSRLLDAVSDLSEDDLVVALISGGGSSLLALPSDGLTLDDEIAVAKALLASGAPISAMNTVRTQLSKIKGGRLAIAAYPAKVVTLIVSDIPGDDPVLVASGPTVLSRSTPQDALGVIERYRLALPGHVIRHLQEAVTGIDADHPCFGSNEIKIIASARASLDAAAALARHRGITAVVLSDAIEGEASEIAKVHAAIAKEVARNDRPFQKPVVMLSGGESTVTLRGKGKGGRNTQFLLSMAIEIADQEDITALAADTDGVDGSEDNAGAFVDGFTIGRLRAAGLDPHDLLVSNDAWTGFNASRDLFVTGPTGTNVNDFRAVLIE